MACSRACSFWWPTRPLRCPRSASPCRIRTPPSSSWNPNSELAIYCLPRSAQGGRMSRDFTGGNGSEEFLLRDPKPGKYTVRINYFGERSQTSLGSVTAQIRLVTGFGTPDQKDKLLTMRLSEKKENVTVGEIEIGE